MKKMEIIVGLLFVCMLTGCNGNDKAETTANANATQEVTKQEETSFSVGDSNEELKTQLSEKSRDTISLHVSKNLTVDAVITPKEKYKDALSIYYASNQFQNDTLVPDNGEQTNKLQPYVDALWNLFYDGVNGYTSLTYNPTSVLPAASNNCVKALGTIDEVVTKFKEKYGEQLPADLSDEYSYSVLYEDTCKQLNEKLASGEVLSNSEKPLKVLPEDTYAYLVRIDFGVDGFATEPAPEQNVQEGDSFEEGAVDLEDLGTRVTSALTRDGYVMFLYTKDGFVSVEYTCTYVQGDKRNEIQVASVETVLENAVNYLMDTYKNHEIEITEVKLVYTGYFLNADTKNDNLRRQVLWPMWIVTYRKNDALQLPLYFYATTGELYGEELD
jgi:hypothetical protein